MVANARVHGTTGEMPADRLEIERTHLRPVAAPYAGKLVRLADRHSPAAPVRPSVGIQHPLAVYDAYAGSAR